MKKSKVKLVSVDRLELNEGQLEWLPKNPRKWKKTDINRMRASLVEDPDFPEERPVLAVQGPDGRLVVFAHNLLTKVAKLDGEPKQLPCVIHEPEAEEDRETIRRRAMKDNGSFGSWDTEEIEGWNIDEETAAKWGIEEILDIEKKVARAKRDKERVGRVPFTEVLGEEHNYICLVFDNSVDWLQAQTLFGLEPVKALPTKKDGEQSEAFQKRIGVGRVLNGAKAIERILSEKEAQQ